MVDLDDFLVFYRKAIDKYENECEKGNEFNLFYLIQDIYGISETKHSRFLAFLLNPDEAHGQKDKYLNLLLDQLGVEYKSDQKRNWSVEAERNNADVSIKCTYPDKISIVIENKCFDAKDQPNQLYRYWYDHIYTYFNRDEKHYFNPNKCRIVYLPKGNWKVYESQSVEKLGADYPEMDVSIITNWTFHEEITRWLGNCKANTESSRIKFFISDYKKYWEETNVKNNLIINQMSIQFKEEKQWQDFSNLLKYKEELKDNWLKQFEDYFKNICEKEWYYYKENNGDLRIYSREEAWEESGLCFVYEYSKGLSIWKEDIEIDQKIKYQIFLEEIFDSIATREFQFIESVFHGNSTYIMEYCNNGDGLVFADEDNYAWNAGNTNLAERITDVLKKYLTHEVKELFDKIDKELL